MRNPISFVALLVVPLMLSACEPPVPADKAAYVGEWRAQNMKLQLTAGGVVHYERVRGEHTITIDAPLWQFEGDNLVVGISFISTTFDVSKPPYRSDGAWRMVVDGVELTRVSSW